jgi:hypothetical protein
VKPQPTDLEWAQGQVPTPYDALEVRWAQDTDDGEFRMEVVSPAGTSGEVWVPLASATQTISLASSGATWLRRDGNYDVYRVGAGSFEFTSAPVTFASLEILVAAFSTDADVTSGLIDKLEAAAAAKKPPIRSNIIDAFTAQVGVQTGKALTPEQAQLLVTLAVALR